MKFDYKKSPKEFFEAYHSKHDDERTLINPDWEWWRVKYHYNLVENDIMYWLLSADKPMKELTVLDIGGGTGHWIDFYTHYLESPAITMVDFSEVVTERLSKRYPDVSVFNTNISILQPNLMNKFDVVNAIGVMFHIADDDLWKAAVSNVCNYLKSGGLAIIGGEFGKESRWVSHHRRARSLKFWTEVVEKNNCKVIGMRENFWISGAHNGGIMNNTLAFIKD